MKAPRAEQQEAAAKEAEWAERLLRRVEALERAAKEAAEAQRAAEEAAERLLRRVEALEHGRDIRDIRQEVDRLAEWIDWWRMSDW